LSNQAVETTRYHLVNDDCHMIDRKAKSERRFGGNDICPGQDINGLVSHPL